MIFKYKKRLFVLLLCFGITQGAVAQQAIHGKVLDALSLQPLENVSVLTAGNAREKALTDNHGDFTLKTAVKSSSIIISRPGYKTDTLTASEINTLAVFLQRQDISLEDVRLNSSGIAKFNTVTKIDLALSPVKTTQDLLRIVPGLFIAQHAGGGKAEQIFLRGFDCDHGTDVQVSVDGMPVNMVSHAHGQGYADAHFIIPETINNIDFGTGPYYTEHGNLNTAGYVAFSTFDNIPGSIAKVEAGRFNTFRTMAMVDLLKEHKEKQSAYAAAEFYYGDGPTVNKQHFNRFNFFTKYNVAMSAKTNLSFSVSAFKSKWNASGQVPERAVESGLISRFGSIDPDEGGNTERYNANLSIAHRYSNGNTWENRLYFSRYKFNLFSDFTFFLNDPINGDEINQAEKRSIAGFASEYKTKHYFNNIILSSAYGTGVRYDATDESKLAHVVKRVLISYDKLGDIKELNANAFMQQQAVIGKWVAEAGARIDYFHFDYFDRLSPDQLPARSKVIVSPKASLQYNFSKSVQLYAKAGKGFHSNDARVVIANAGKQILPAAYGADLGIIIKPARNLLLNIAAWNLYLAQEFVYVGDDGNAEPAGRTKRQGIDLIARYQLMKALFINTNINVTKARARDEAKGADYIPLAPTATSTGGIFYKKKRGISGGISYRYLKSRPANEDNSVAAKGYCIVDASLNYTQPKYEVGISVENLLNAKWNEAQFATESRLQSEPAPVTDLNFTPGTPVFAKLKLAVFF